MYLFHFLSICLTKNYQFKAKHVHKAIVVGESLIEPFSSWVGWLLIYLILYTYFHSLITCIYAFI